ELARAHGAEAGLFAKEHMKKPVIAYIAGLSAPKGRRMGHAGAIVSAFGESAAEKVEILKGCGVAIAPTPSEMGSTVAQVLGKQKKVA
ncbi:MAG: succinate--CoA ligase subunit alpha, partial [Hyphomicrobium denitrificans]|nr:succinate--CoA ligase subunit alpha [Hyphomicrobium denitrificans]